MINVIRLLYALDEERRLTRQLILERRALRDSQNPFSKPTNDFIRTYRLSKDAALYVIEEIRPAMTAPLRSDAIPLELKVLASLNFFASGSYQRRTGNDFQANMGQSTFSIYLGEVVDAINSRMLHEWVRFPMSNAERQRVKQDFYEIASFPGVIGAVDGTHVGIFTPSENEHVYVNRKRYHSLNVMIVCDANLEITTINARYPGSSHDSFVWSNSALKQVLEDEDGRGVLTGYLLGDSGYPLQPWLMTPILNTAAGSSRRKFTDAHIKTRCTVERCIGVLKARFRCLIKYRTLHYTPLKAAKIVNACAVLHNICIKQRVPNLFDPFLEDPDGTSNTLPPPHNTAPNSNTRVRGDRIRERIVQTHF